jgi:hypothetical protein
LGQQCESKVKATGKRCERRVVAANVCWVHGLNARQTRAKRDQRVALWEVQEARAAEPVVVVQREPEELLLDALHDVNQVLQQIKADLPGGSVNPILLPLAGDWLDRLSRLGKIAVDLSRKLHERLGWLAEDRVATLWGHLAAIVEASPLSAQQRLTLWESRFDGLRAVADGRAPFRLPGDEVHRREVDPPIEVESATWSAGGQLDWWVKERRDWWGRVRGQSRQRWIRAADLRRAKSE